MRRARLENERRADLTARLIRANSADLTGLWEDMLKALSARSKHYKLLQARRVARDAPTDQIRRIRRAQCLASLTQYGRVVKALSQLANLDLSSTSVQNNLQELRSELVSLAIAIFRRDMPHKSVIEPTR